MTNEKFKKDMKVEYRLSSDVFTSEMQSEIYAWTGLVHSDQMADWWMFFDKSISNQKWKWEELVYSSLKILNMEATRRFCNFVYVKDMPKELNMKNPKFLPCCGIRSSDKIVINKCETNKFKFNEGSEGSWLDWVKLACNILANENTEIVCPCYYEENSVIYRSDNLLF
ncbi:MAG: hypothetical protein GY870_05400 [archaeon]|nr:hypothetical protein [archaeon]